jgi:hypothetical protein
MGNPVKFPWHLFRRCLDSDNICPHTSGDFSPVGEPHEARAVAAGTSNGFLHTQPSSHEKLQLDLD